MIGYTEKHHIFPKSIFGKNSSIVKLTAKEHFIAHHLLWKYYQKKYGSLNRKTIKMMNSFWNMSNKRGTKTAKYYEILKKEKSESMKGTNNPLYGKINPMQGKKHAQKSKDLISKNLIGFKHSKEFCEKNRENKRKFMVSIERIDIQTGEIKEYESIAQAGRDDFHIGHIFSCCVEKLRTHKKYYWKYAKIGERPSPQVS